MAQAIVQERDERGPLAGSDERLAEGILLTEVRGGGFGGEGGERAVYPRLVLGVGWRSRGEGVARETEGIEFREGMKCRGAVGSEVVCAAGAGALEVILR